MSETDERVEALMAKCSCGHLAMHGWHLKYGCQGDDCACDLGAGGALLASDWLRDVLARERAAALRDRDSAERRVERACEVLDGWERDGPDGYEFHLLILRVREALDGGVE